jgi:ferredoxin
MAGVKGNFNVSVDKGLCIGCNLCCEVAEEVFYMKGEKSEIKKGANLTDASTWEKVTMASQACPVMAIKVK